MNVSAQIRKTEKTLEQLKSQQKFVNFLSPGTLISEHNIFPLETDEPNLKKLAQKAQKICQRYGAKPYAFRIEDGNGKALTGLYWLTGKIVLYDDIPETKGYEILKSNMKNNSYAIAIENTNSYKFTYFFAEEDVIIDWNGNITRRGNDADLMAYRKKFKEKSKK